MTPNYSLIRSSRKTLALQINKYGELIVRAPTKMQVELIESFIEKKRGWIKKHQIRIQNTIESRVKKKDCSDQEIGEMKKILREYLIPRIEEFWRDNNLPKYTSIKITKSEHRWGSCSGKNGLCFSYRLAEYLCSNTRFIDAIITHELAHLKEKNHQKPFWNLVYSMMPEYETVIKQVKIGVVIP